MQKMVTQMKHLSSNEIKAKIKRLQKELQRREEKQEQRRLKQQQQQQ